MGKFSSFVIGGVVGVVTGLAIDYLFGPARDTTYDERYRSRLDHALEEGQKAADEQEAAMRRKFVKTTSAQELTVSLPFNVVNTAKLPRQPKVSKRH